VHKTKVRHLGVETRTALSLACVMPEGAPAPRLGDDICIYPGGKGDRDICIGRQCVGGGTLRQRNYKRFTASNEVWLEFLKNL
jgi:hypothetical protein